MMDWGQIVPAVETVGYWQSSMTGRDLQLEKSMAVRKRIFYRQSGRKISYKQPGDSSVASLPQNDNSAIAGLSSE